MARLVTFDDGHFLASGAGYYASVPPSLALSVVSTEFSEGATITFRVTANKLWDEDITVAYATSDGTATQGVDYTAASGTVTLPAGSTTVDLSVVTIDREGVQSDRTFTMTISSPLTASGDVPAIETAARTVTIEDTDVALPVPSLVASVIGPAEEGSPLTFRVATQGNAPTPSAITFQYETQDSTALNGVDYVATAGNGFIAAGASSQEFTVTTILRAGAQPARQVRFVITTANTTIATATATGVITDTEVATGPNAYWETLQADPAFQASMSEDFRNQTRLDTLSQANPNQDVTYNPGADTYARAKDAAKVVIGPWQRTSKVKVQVIAPMSATDMTVQLADLAGNVTKVPTYLNSRGRQVKIGDEIMILTETQPPLDRLTGILTIGQRGAYGTTPVAHAVGERPVVGGSSLDNQVHKPFFTEDGYTYLFTWDVCHTKQWQRSGIGGYKTFMFLSNSLWLEPQNMFPENSNPATGFDLDTHVGWAGRARSYLNTGGNADFTLNPVTIPGRLGPGVTGNQPIEPYADGSTGEFFLMYPDRWTRYWLRIQQRANDYAILDLWIADEQQEARQVYSNVLAEVRGDNWNGTGWSTPRRIKQFEIRFNTSNAFVTEDIATAWPTLGLEAFRDLVSYVKNFAVLRWTNGTAPDISTYLVKPEFES